MIIYLFVSDFVLKPGFQIDGYIVISDGTYSNIQVLNGLYYYSHYNNKTKNSNTNSQLTLQMQTKQNQLLPRNKPSQYYTQSSKSQSRYRPLQQIDTNFNNVQIYSPHKKYKVSNKLSFNQISKQSNMNFLQSINNSAVSVSMRERCRMLQINTINQLIASARSKKSEIEDLLRQEQIKTQMQDLEEVQATASMRKLKKVVRLMQIVCKIILGRNQQNSYIDMNSQQDISIRQMQSLSMQNFQRELANKNSQILRLKKFVEILSVPNKQLSHSLINSVNNSTIMDSVRNSFEKHEPRKEAVVKLNDSFVQTDFIVFNDQTKKNETMLKANHKFQLCEEYSLWNILDANQRKDFKQYEVQTQVQQQVMQNQQQKMIMVGKTEQSPVQEKKDRKFTLTAIQPIQIDAKCAFIKRFKSIVKITFNAINLCNNIFLRACRTTQSTNIASDILELTNYFNKKYHDQNGYYDDDFCKQIKDKITSLYERVHRIYKQSKLDLDLVEYSLY